MPSDVILEAFHGGKIVVRVLWNSGESCAKAEGENRQTPPPCFKEPHTFDRLILYDTDDSGRPLRFVLDCVAARGKPDDRLDTFLQLEGTTPKVDLLRFRCLLRCFIAGELTPFVDLAGVLKQGQGGWLQFRDRPPTFGGRPQPNTSCIRHLHKAWTTVAAELPPALPVALGLRPALAHGGETVAGFVGAPYTSRDGANLKDVARYDFVVRFVRPLSLERREQELRVGPIHVALGAGVLRDAGLHECPSWPAGAGKALLTLRGPALIQTNLVFNDDNMISPADVGNWVVTVRGLPAAPLVDAWNQAVVVPYLAALETVQAGQPISVLPLLTPLLPPPSPCAAAPCPGVPTALVPVKTPAPGSLYDAPWLVTLSVRDKRPGRAPIRVADFSCGPGRPPAFELSFRSAQPVVRPPVQVSKGHLLTGTFPALRCHTGQPFQAVWEPRSLLALRGESWRIDPLRQGEVQGLVEGVATGFAFGLRQWFGVVKDDHHPRQDVRIGALDLAFGPAPGAVEATALDYKADPFDENIIDRQSILQAGFHGARGGATLDLPAPDVKVRLRVERLTPGGQDGLPDEPFTSEPPPLAAGAQVADAVGGVELPSVIDRRFGREPAVIVATDPTPATRFTLDVHESAASDRSQALSMQLFEREAAPAVPGAPAGGDSLQPMRLLVIDRQPLLVACVYAPPFRGLSGADGNRQVGNWSGTNPSGASWELTGATDGFRLTFPPQALGEAMKKWKSNPNTTGDVDEGMAAAFKLGTLADFRLAASYFRQNFVEATWNLRRLLGYPRQRAPGAGIISLAFELLYGMTCRVDAPGLRLAELPSHLGAVPGRLPSEMTRPLLRYDHLKAQDQVFEAYKSRWSKQYAAYLARLGVYEARAEGQGQLVLRNGVVYRLRNLDDLAYDPTRPVAEQGAEQKKNPQLLPGGALWGADFRSIYEPLLRPEARQSTAGELSRPAFSALGGWGFQKAVFQNGLTTIYSDTAMGRVFTYSVERRGRIGSYWHPAKHVVVFERTVVPTEQFRDEQDPLLGRPVVRKVREYVELLQPDRSYPDLGAASVTRGCVLGCRFQRKIIPVTGRWGHDLTDAAGNLLGYVIPLWRPDANPLAYPKPQVHLRLAGMAGGDDAVMGLIDDPEKLQFFSPAYPPDLTKDPMNSDLWDAVRDVDFPDEPTPAAPAPSPADVNADLDATRPDAPSHEPGHERFTYTLTGISRPVDMVRDRSNKAVGSLLANVTMVRARPLAGPIGDAGVKAQNAHAQIRGLRGDIAAVADELFAGLPRSGSVGSADLKALENRVNGEMEKLQSGVSGALGKLEQSLGTAASKPRDWSDAALKGVQRWGNDAQNFLTTQLRDVLERDLPITGDVVTNAKRFVHDKLEIFTVAVRDVTHGWQQLQSLVEGAGAVVRELKNRPDAELRLLRGQLEPLLKNVANDAMKDWPAAARDEYQRRLADARDRYLNAVHAALGRAAASLDPVFKDYGKWLREAEQKFGAAVDDVFRKLRDPAKDVLKQVERGLTDLKQNKDLQEVEDKLAAARGSIAKASREVERFILDNQNTLDEWQNKIRSDVNKALENVKSRAESIAKIGNTIGNLQKKIADKINDVQGVIKEQYKDLKDTLLDEFKLDDYKQRYKDQLETVQKNLQAVAKGYSDIADLRRGVDRVLGEARGVADELTARAGPLLRRLPAMKDALYQEKDNVLRMVRAFGDSPVVAGMKFNRDRIAFFYDPLKQLTGKLQAVEGMLPLDVTPVTALVNRAGNQLKALGVRLPTGQLLDRILPTPDELLKNFDFSKMLPDFAGLNLAKMLPDLKAPAGLKDRVKISHEFDKQTGRGWVQADINIPVAGPTVLFNAGVIQVLLAKALFFATVRIEAGLGGASRSTQSGRLTADWGLTFSGSPLITFRETTLRFDETGKTHFDLNPEKVEMSGVLQMVSKVLSKISTSGSGFTFKLLEQNGMPVGVEAVLNLPLPDIAFGPCSISNLSFGAMLRLAALPEFAIELAANLARKTSPFTLIVFILGGGGWFELRARYLPLSGRITTAVSIGINAGAKLAIALGPIKGSLFAFFYIEGELQTDTAGDGNHLALRIGLLLGGEVDILGLITASITLLLELEYSSDSGALIGRGTLSIHIKICFFLSINIDVKVEKRFAKVGGGSGNKDVGRLGSWSNTLVDARPDALPNRADRSPTLNDVIDAYLDTLE